METNATKENRDGLDAVRHLHEWSSTPPEPLDEGPFKSGLHVYQEEHGSKKRWQVYLRQSENEAAEREEEEQELQEDPWGGVNRLVFDSHFESGNLGKALRMGEWEYELLIEQDIRENGGKNGKWFYFSVENLMPETTYVFHIVGFTRAASLFGSGGGCLPLFYSEALAKQDGVGWRRIGTNVSYDAINLQEFVLSFSFQLNEEAVNGKCFFAQAYPYTYTDLQLYLADLESNPKTAELLQRSELCRTVAGNRCDMLTIGSGPEDIILTARVHPGETNASFMIRGVIDSLLDTSFEAATELRKRFTFKIIPMLNPDGVKYGLSRTSLSRVDLNRVYATADAVKHPTIWHVKELAGDLENLRVFCDFHGHSTKHNVFAFGCPRENELSKYQMRSAIWKSRQTGSSLQDQETDNTAQQEDGMDRPPLSARKLVEILDDTSELFSAMHSQFKPPPKNASAGRTFFHKEYDGAVLSITLEASQGGIQCDTDETGLSSGFHLNVSHFHQIGREFIVALAQLAQNET